jgi:hypothetical protein
MPSLIGNKPNQVPSNGDLGTLAFQDANAVNITGGVVGVSAGTASAPAITTTGDTNTGIFFPAADTIAFSEGGAEVARFDSSGRLGVGTSNPGEKLEVQGKVQIAPNQTLGAALLLSADAAGANGTEFETTYYGGSYGPMKFKTGGSERMRVSSTGQLLVGITSIAEGHYLGGDFSNKWTLFVQNTNASLPNGILVNYNNTAPNNTARDFFYATDSAAQRMSVRSNGGIANYSGNNVNLSDAREKTNVELAGSYLDKICAIPVKTFNYIDQNLEEDAGLTLGVIAQEVQAVAPELVMESNWGTQEEPKMRLSIYQTDLQYALMKCIQEQQTIITDLKSRIEILESSQG